jgi:hypothetical protein
VHSAIAYAIRLLEYWLVVEIFTFLALDGSEHLMSHVPFAPISTSDSSFKWE